MNYFDLYSSYPDRTIAAAWDSRVKEADNIPWLTDTLTAVWKRIGFTLCDVLRGASRPAPQARGEHCSASLRAPANSP